MTIQKYLKRYRYGAIVAVGMLIAGALALASTQAANFVATSEAESGLAAAGAETFGTGQASGGSAVRFAAPGTVPSAARIGFNAPNQGRVYIMDWDQVSVTAADPLKPFRIAKANGVGLMRVFTWDDATIGKWKQDNGAAVADMVRMCNDAYSQGVRLILSPRLDKPDIEALSGKVYADWPAARKDIVTAGSSGYATFGTLLGQSAQALRDNPCVYSMEVVNEPPYMLGMDDGSISRDQGIAFVDHMQSVLKANGAARVNSGSWPLYDPTLLTDTQVTTFMRNADIIDAHFYPPDPGNAATGSPTQAAVLLGQHAAYASRVRTLLGRPDMPVMIGEVGTLPWPAWSKTMTDGALERGWTVLPWGFDAFDVNRFNETDRPEVLQYIRSVAL